jgi:hypothetical protein
MRGSFTMSEQDDKYKLQAEKLLPCNCKDNMYYTRGKHLDSCFASRRPAVAAALRAQGAEIERLQALDKVSAKAHNSNLLEMGDMRRVIAQLKAQLGEAKSEIRMLNIAMSNMDDVFKQGMEYAAAISERYGSSYIAEHIRAATAQPDASDEVFNEVRRP